MKIKYEEGCFVEVNKEMKSAERVVKTTNAKNFESSTSH